MSRDARLCGVNNCYHIAPFPCPSSRRVTVCVSLLFYSQCRRYQEQVDCATKSKQNPSYYFDRGAVAQRAAVSNLRVEQRGTMDPPAPHHRLSLPGKMTNTSRSPPCIFFYFVGIVGVCIITQMIHHFHVATKFSKEMIPEPMAGGPPVDHGANHDHLQHQQQQHQKKTKRLNVIIFYPDDWTHHDLGGVVPVLKTPFLSQLAREGIRFTHNAVTTSICWISRATLFTGQYVSKHASTHLFRPYFSKKGGAWERSWPALLQSAGYYTGLVGKWQYQSPHPKLFDFQRMYHGPHWWPKGDDSGEVEHTCEKTQRDAIDFLNERPLDKPFALTVSLGPPKGKCESCRMHLSMNIVLLSVLSRVVA